MSLPHGAVDNFTRMVANRRFPSLRCSHTKKYDELRCSKINDFRPILANCQLSLHKTKKIKKLFCALLLLFFTSCTYALSFEIPKNGTVIGTPKTAIVREDEDFSDIAQRYDIGYYELFEANPGVDPDNPPPNTALIIPTQYIIPPELHENSILVNLAEMRLYYRPPGMNRIYIYPVGIGKEDWNTPTGAMKIIGKTANPKWIPPESIYKFRQAIGDPVPRVVMPGPDNPLGKYKLRLSNPEYLIHGTNAPEGVGRRTSSGCMRLYPNDIEQLFNMVKVGTKVLIINKPYKAGWLDGKLYLEAHMPLFEERLHWGNDVSPALKIVETVAGAQVAQVDWQKARQVAQEHLCIPRVIGG